MMALLVAEECISIAWLLLKNVLALVVAEVAT